MGLETKYFLVRNFPYWTKIDVLSGKKTCVAKNDRGSDWYHEMLWMWQTRPKESTNWLGVRGGWALEPPEHGVGTNPRQHPITRHSSIYTPKMGPVI